MGRATKGFEMPDDPDLILLVNEAFAQDMLRAPSVSLRGGDAIDGYYSPIEFDPDVDALDDEYIENKAYNALPYLDAESWRHYLPALIRYTVSTLGRTDSLTPDGLLWSLRPPDREPPRLGSLSEEQKAAIRAFLEYLAFEAESDLQPLACQILEEYWIENPLYGER
jgi:hypothetical protein